MKRFLSPKHYQNPNLCTLSCINAVSGPVVGKEKNFF